MILLFRFVASLFFKLALGLLAASLGALALVLLVGAVL